MAHELDVFAGPSSSAAAKKKVKSPRVPKALKLLVPLECDKCTPHRHPRPLPAALIS